MESALPVARATIPDPAPRGSGAEARYTVEARALELTILMPCLNEAETVATCVRKARRFLERAGIAGQSR